MTTQKKVIFGLIGVAALVGGILIYRYYKKKKEDAAQKSAADEGGSGGGGGGGGGASIPAPAPAPVVRPIKRTVIPRTYGRTRIPVRRNIANIAAVKPVNKNETTASYSGL